MASKNSNSGSQPKSGGQPQGQAGGSGAQRPQYPDNKPSTTGGVSGGGRSNRSPGQPK